MNETVVHRLEVLVEQCVRPVRTEFANKKRMREDLLSHLSSTYEDEFQKSQDEAGALKLTHERFGEPAEVSRELRQSVTLSETFGYWFEQALGLQANETFLHQAAKHQLVSFAVLLGMIAIGLLFGLHRGDPLLMVWVFASIMVVAGLTGSLMQWLTDRMGRARIHQSRQRMWRYGFFSLLMFPGMLVLDYLLLGLGPGIDSFQPSQSAWITALAVAPLGPLTTFLMGPKSAERTLYLEKWAAVDLPAE